MLMDLGKCNVNMAVWTIHSLLLNEHILNNFENNYFIFRAMINFFLVFFQAQACCIYWVFVGSNLKYMLDNFTPKIYPLYGYMMVLFLPHVAIVCVRNFKVLALFSLFANTVSFVTFGVVFYYIFENLDQDFNDRPAIGRLRDFPLFFGTVMFSLQAIPMVRQDD